METITAPRPSGVRLFEFERDTFAYANETKWRYEVDETTQRQIMAWRNPIPEYTLRCFVMVRAVKQFFLHAQFKGDRHGGNEDLLRNRIAEVMRRSPRVPAISDHPVILTGPSSLRDLSREHEKLLKVTCGGVWQSYFQRGNWRMVLPVWPSQQERIARQAQASILSGTPAAVHIYRFPEVAINHGLLFYEAAEGEREIRFNAYDPNTPEHPLTVTFDKSARQFAVPPTHYFKGGKVNAYCIYCGLLF